MLWLICICIFFILLVWGFLLPMQAKGVNAQLLLGGEGISITIESSNLFFASKDPKPQPIEILFYPGALVDPVAYVPLCHDLAKSGCDVRLFFMPLRWPPLGWKSASLYAKEKEEKSYLLCGHSLGGKMAARYAAAFPHKLDGLILLGTSHPWHSRLKDSALPILKIGASKDGIAAPTRMRRKMKNLPSQAELRVIAGGNHSNFGFYGFQPGDKQADIGREEQKQQLLELITAFANKLSRQKS